MTLKFSVCFANLSFNFKMLNELQIGIRAESLLTSEMALNILCYMYTVSIADNEVYILTYSENYSKICILQNQTFSQDLIIYLKISK